ncbi:zinc finger and SCAN domain-containing protein 2-like [Armigeres subalbatus]|uniref:zinc finger and SCAN domain-containing protein 2-like n=1 Tax=Armigeres subalbatus TaxID=124917 RepID=UPI002ED5BBAD
MGTFNLSTFPDVCRLCLQSKHPDELVSVDTVRPLFDRKLVDLLEELTFKIPSKVVPYFPSEVCSMCLEVVDFFFKYKQKMNFIHQFLVAFVEVKLGNDHSLRKLFEDHNVYFSILFKDLDLCNKEDLLVDDMLSEYSQYKIASMPVVKQEVDFERVPEEQPKEESSESDSYEFQIEVLDEKDNDAFLVERLLEKLGQVKQNDGGEKTLEIKAEPVQLIGSEEPGEIEEVVYSDSEALEDVLEIPHENSQDEKSNENIDFSKDEEEMDIEVQVEKIDSTPSEIFKCTKCKYKTIFKNALAIHEKRHKQYDHLKGIHCRHPSCLKVFATKEEFEKHLKEGLHKLHICDICGATLKHKYSLEVHLSRHAGTTRFNCSYCSSSFYTKTELQNHVRSIHTTGERWECPKCGSVFKNRKLLNQHLESHVEERNFKCDACEFAFKTLQHLRRHVSTVHKSVRFNCEHCSVSYGRKDKLRMHMERAHNIQSYFICDICVRTFSDSASLDEHKNHHANPKPLECPVCLLAFENNKSYDAHACITYRDDYVCCGKDFKFHINYNRHMLSEHGTKMNARVKPASGMLVGNLRAHRRRNMPPSCRMCGKECTSLMERRKHEAKCGVRKRVPSTKVSNDKPEAGQEPGDEMGEEEHLIEDETVEFIIDEDAETTGIVGC